MDSTNFKINLPKINCTHFSYTFDDKDFALDSLDFANSKNSFRIVNLLGYSATWFSIHGRSARLIICPCIYLTTQLIKIFF